MKLNIKDELFNKEELINTPKRVDRFLKEWEDNRQDFNFTMFVNPGYKGMVIIKDIAFASLCAHHLLPFTGIAHIGYIPGDRICGASKLIRALEKFASKPQTQEKLTAELIYYLEEKLHPLGLIVVIEASHECMRIRGVRNPSSKMVTSEVRGVFLKEEVGKHPKEEFLRLIGK